MSMALTLCGWPVVLTPHTLLFLVLSLVNATASSDLLLAVSGLDSYDGFDFGERNFTTTMLGSVVPFLPYDGVPGSPYKTSATAEKWRMANVNDQRALHQRSISAGLSPWSGTDIFVVPASIYNASRDKFMEGGRPGAKIALNNFTLGFLNGMIDEVFEVFPELTGIVVRVGENYGGPQGPVDWVSQGAVDFGLSFLQQQLEYVTFITTLREAVCVRHNRQLIFRTWDTSGFSPSRPARFHPSKLYYLNVTDKIQPHPKLIFSIKHTALDFWRWVAFNPSLAIGQHQQLVEVECAREYEGKGAMPSYIGQGVIDGFEEFNETGRDNGIGSIINDRRIVGLWLWASGGGWAGPHVIGETHDGLFWPKTNALVLAYWWQRAWPLARREGEIHLQASHNLSMMSETDAFLLYCATELKMAPQDCVTLYQLSITSQSAILATRYCSPYDSSLQANNSELDNACGSVSCMPTNNWLRDDRLGGLQMLGTPTGEFGNAGAIYWMWATDHTINGSKISNHSDIALIEKRDAVSLWTKIIGLANSIQSGDPALRSIIVTTSIYGKLISEVIERGWTVLITGYDCEHNTQKACNTTLLKNAITDYDTARKNYNNTINQLNNSATPFLDAYEGGETSGHSDWAPGLGVSIDHFRNFSINTPIKKM